MALDKRSAYELVCPSRHTSNRILQIVARRTFLTGASLGLLAIGIGMPSARAADEAGAKQEVPLKKTVLFSSGVGFFERRAEIDGNAQVDLKFNVENINDLLKSMVVQDLGDGRVSSVTYGSRDPITKTLRTFAIDLTTNPTLGQLLAQIRGEKVEVEAPTKITGTIVGIETRRRQVEKESVTYEVLNLLTADGLRSVSLENVGKIKLLDEKLDADLRKALTTLALGHANDKKTVSLSFLGKGKRPVRIGYIQESPIWKTSYRMVLSDDAKPYLQGWAIIENTTEEDWKDVQLTLVSGRPISFIMDLYQPLYVNRPVVEPELYASLRPPVYEQDLANKDAQFRRAAADGDDGVEADRLATREKKSAQFKRAPNAPLADGKPGDVTGAPPAAKYRGEAGDWAGKDLASTAKSLAQASDVGELFQYAIENPVSLPRRQSAMLPIVNESIEGEKVSIYDPAVHAKHPLNGLMLKNTTALNLMQGPVTVFDDGVYAGDARIADLSPGTTRLVSYAMDLDTEVVREGKPAPDQYTLIKCVKGTLFTTQKFQRSSLYTVKNSGKKQKKVLIEQPIDASWTLIAPAKPEEKTRDKYRFAVAAKPGAPATLSVDEERTVGQQIALTNLDENAINFYISRPVISEKLKDALAHVITRKRAILEVVAEIQRREQQVQIIGVEQARIRQNMAQLDKNTDLYNRYVKKFAQQEDQVETLRTEVEGLRGQEAKLRKALDEYLVGLSLD